MRVALHPDPGEQPDHRLQVLGEPVPGAGGDRDDPSRRAGRGTANTAAVPGHAVSLTPTDGLAPPDEFRWTTGSRHRSGPRGPVDQEMWRSDVSPTTGGPEGTATQTAGERLGLKTGMVVQELGWDEDVDDALRMQIEDTIDADMVDGNYGNVVDAVLLWWRDNDGDLVDALVDSLTDLVAGGAIWLLTPKVGRPAAVDPADVAEAAPIAGLSTTTTAAVSQDWAATRLVAPKSGR